MTLQHLSAQRAVVRMLFDPAFSAEVRRRPESVFPDLGSALQKQLATLDPRALRRDALRRQRTLGVLFSELKATTTLALAERGSIGFLEQFFESVHFHQAVDTRGSLALGYAAYLEEAIVVGQLKTPLLADVLRIEAATMRARREDSRSGSGSDSGSGSGSRLEGTSRVRLAAGVHPVEVAAAALGAIQAVERYLFEVGLLPPLVLCLDAPRSISVPKDDGRRLHLVTVPTASGVSLVTVEAELHALFACLTIERPISAVLAEARLRGLDPVRARSLLEELVQDEMIWVRHGG